MTTYLEIHAIQDVPPANINRDDTGSPKTATYGGVVRGRVSSQSWKRAMRRDFNLQHDPKDVGVRSKRVVSLLAEAVVERAPGLKDRAEDLATAALESAGFKPAKKSKKDEAAAELGYLLFISRHQIEAVADVIVASADAPDLKAAFKAAKVKDLLDAEHSIDIALFGRMVADAPDLNVDAACQVAHALGVHEVTPEFDYFTAVDDVTEAAEEAGAGMIGTVEFYSSTFYRYAVVNIDRLRENLGDEDAVDRAIKAFVKAFVESMPTGKQNTFANGTRPAVVMVTVGEGQPASLVGAFEEPVKDALGYVKPAVQALTSHATHVFDTWRRPETVLVCGLPDARAEMNGLGEAVAFDELVERAAVVAHRGVS
ncbi:type I-E CRISPR-associated protein Cas7/Cse4/CasC [Naumannella sp. ID2617S]|nr:type I-E CRISPR-associated protein Cas7/Cse4/CasC [Naumannella sp. ID2617S]